MTYKEAIEKELEINFLIAFEEASKRIKGLKEKTFNNVKSQWKKRNRNNSGINGKKTKKSIPPQDTVLSFIDDPDELLLSTAIRELNKPNPDPRWATILINCKKEQITNKKNVMDQFRQLPTKALVNILKANLQEEP